MYNSYSGLGTSSEATSASAEALRNLVTDYASAKDSAERSGVIDFFLDARLGPLLTQMSKTTESSIAALDNKIKIIETAKKVNSASNEDLAVLPSLRTLVSTYMTLSGLASQYMLLTAVQARDIYRTKSTKTAFSIIKNLLIAQKTIVPKDVEEELAKFAEAVNASKSSEETDKAFEELLKNTGCQLNKSEWSKTFPEFESASPNVTDLKIQILLIALKGFAAAKGAMTNKEYSKIAEKDNIKLKDLYEALKAAIIKNKQSSVVAPAAPAADEGLGTGAIVGIIAGIGVLAGGAWWYSQQKSKKG